MADYKKSSVHCHSTMCDGKNTLQEMASAACAQGLTTLGFTGHSYTQRDREYCMSPSRTAQYKATIAKLKTEYKGKVDILCGIEWDLLSEDKRTGYDYWIGSAHHLYGKNTGKYYEIDFRPQDLHDCIYDDFDGDPLAAVEAYFAEVEKVAAMGPDILAHIDLIKKLNAAGEFFDEESPRYKAAALKALNAAKEHGCLLEVNTGGVYRYHIILPILKNQRMRVYPCHPFLGCLASHLYIGKHTRLQQIILILQFYAHAHRFTLVIQHLIHFVYSASETPVPISQCSNLHPVSCTYFADITFIDIGHHPDILQPRYSK